MTNPLVLGLGKFLQNNNSANFEVGHNFKNYWFIGQWCWLYLVPISRWDQIWTLIWDIFKVNFKVRIEFQVFTIETSFKLLLFIRSMNGDHINVIGTCFPLGSQSSMILTLIYNSLPWFFLVVLTYFNFGGWHGFNSLINVHGVFINLI
jgi:hypothetical protein